MQTENVQILNSFQSLLFAVLNSHFGACGCFYFFLDLLFKPKNMIVLGEKCGSLSRYIPMVILVSSASTFATTSLQPSDRVSGEQPGGNVVAKELQMKHWITSRSHPVTKPSNLFQPLPWHRTTTTPDQNSFPAFLFTF